jgi:hypothetical protein
VSRSGFHNMGTTRIARICTTGIAAVALIAMVGGCSSKSKSTATAGSTSSSDAAVATDSASPTKVVATGGGNFCKQVAQSMNAANVSAAGSDTTSIKQSVQQYQALKSIVLKSAPGAIKGDLTTLFGAVDKMYSALAAANYDYSKLDPTILTSLENPAVLTAEQHVNDYIKNTCGIDTGLDTSEAPAAAASASAALASALAKLTASAAPSS